MGWQCEKQLELFKKPTTLKGIDYYQILQLCQAHTKKHPLCFSVQITSKLLEKEDASVL